MVLTGGLILYLLNRYAERPPLKMLTVVIAAMTTMTVLVSLYRRTHWLTDLVAGALVGGLLLQAIIVMDRMGVLPRLDGGPSVRSGGLLESVPRGALYAGGAIMVLWIIGWLVFLVIGLSTLAG